MVSRLFSHSSRRRGVALVVVLCSLVLVTVMTVAFLSAISTERQTAASYGSGTEVRLLADSVVNLVIARLREASERDDRIWTSQPGLLRTFTLAGSPAEVHRLYSSLTPTSAADSFDPAADVPGGWSEGDPAMAADYVDLNRPVTVGDGEALYPILDPRVLDAQGVSKVEGFSLQSAPYGAAMPVRWVYLLADGTMSGPDQFNAANPPVARLAWWTDDETCKLNINTASEGFYWDLPRTGTEDDYRMAQSQPLQREYQGYPGHPATTSLSPVLWSYFKAQSPTMIRSNSADPNVITFPETLYAMLPRTHGGGSQGAHVLMSTIGSKLPLKNERLLTSVDELAFLAPPPGDAGDRQPNPYFDRKTVEAIRFFLTANSRAPELNLSGQPRVTIWPIHANADENHRTPFDRLIAFASTINGAAYYFTRSNPASMTADFSGRNVKLYEYLQRLTGQGVPGFGSLSFLSKYGAANRNQILTEIFDYIRCVNLIDSSSWSKDFQTFTPNSFTKNSDVAHTEWEGSLSYFPIPGLGQVVPIVPPAGTAGAGTHGFGRFHTINRVLLVISASNDYQGPPPKAPELQGTLFFELFNPALGHATICPDFSIVVTTTKPFEILTGQDETTTATFSFSGSNPVNEFPSRSSSRNAGGYDGFVPNTVLVNQRWKNAPGQVKYPFISAPVTLHPDAKRLEFKGGEVSVALRLADGSDVQTFTFAFPPFTSDLPVRSPEQQPGQGYAFRFYENPWMTGSHNKVDPTHFRGVITPHWIVPGADVARSLEPMGVEADLRLSMAQDQVTSAFAPIAGYTDDNPRVFSAMGTMMEVTALGGLVFADGRNVTAFLASNGNRFFGKLVKDAISEDRANFDITPSLIPAEINGVVNADGAPGDWDTGIGTYPNGPFINKPDDGNAKVGVPYITSDQYSRPPGDAFSSPSRQMPSAVMFGSLPSGARSTPPAPWQTLLFCPNPASRYGPAAKAHPGEAEPKDHLLLDLFHMPVVEPYAISEPFSTAGKVNLNHQIIPFTGIERKTALYGVLDAVKITAINDAREGNFFYKKYRPSATKRNYRYPIQIPETLRYIDEHLQRKGAFRSASEICEIPLVPDPAQLSADPYPWSESVSSLPDTTRATVDDFLQRFWAFHRFTGDNLRENPYSRLLPRLTTRSNTYRVHLWVQTLQKVPSAPAQKWTEGKDRVTGEYRGSYLLERYLDPSEPGIPDAATDTHAGNLNRFYRYRVISTTQFNP